MYRFGVLLAIAVSFVFQIAQLPAADLRGTYDWKPVCLGGGGWMTGIICSETNANIRYARTDTGQAYRWSPADAMWLPMIVHRDDGSGFGTNFISNYRSAQNIHLALDPNDNNIVYHWRPIG